MNTTMKTIATPLAVAAALILPAQAGDDFVAPPQPYQPAPVEENDLSWFIGASAGYLDVSDFEDAMYTAHIGKEIGEVGGWTSSVYLEGGFSESDDSLGGVDIDAKIIPITLNYKLDKTISGGFGIYAGVGAGVAILDVEISSFFGSVDDDDTAFYGQAMLGLELELSDAFELFAGARYVYIDETDFDFGASLDSQDGVFYEGGFRLKF